MTRRVILLSIAAAAAVALPPALRAQSASFDVASVKPSNPTAAGPLGSVPMILPALGRLTAQNVTLRMLVMAAYQKQGFQIVGGPSWQNSEKFDINARSEEASPTPDATLERLRTLLADRFKLKVHTETREVPIHELVMARSDGKTGAKLKPSAADCPDAKVQQQQLLEAFAKGGLAAIAAMRPSPGETRPCSIAPLPAAPGSIGLRATGQAMSVLTTLLTQFTGRPVLDRTGLTGLYDFDLAIDLQTVAEMSAQLGINLPPLPQGFPQGPSLATYLQEELGLKLESGRGPGEVLVIDSAELPTPD